MPLNRNIVIGTLGTIQAATLSGGPTASSAPISNLKEWQAYKPVIFTDPTQRYVDIDHGEPTPVRLTALAFVSAPDGLEFRHVAAETAEGLEAPAYASPWQAVSGGEPGLVHRSGLKHDWHWDASAPSYRHRRIEFNDAVFATDNRLQFSKLIVTYGFQPTYNMGLGHAPPGLVDPSFAVTAVEGQGDLLSRRKHDIADFTLYHLSRSEALGSIRELHEEVGTTVAFMTIFNPHAADFRQSESLYGRFTDLRQPRKQTQLEYSLPISIREDLP